MSPSAVPLARLMPSSSRHTPPSCPRRRAWHEMFVTHSLETGQHGAARTSKRKLANSYYLHGAEVRYSATASSRSCGRWPCLSERRAAPRCSGAMSPGGRENFDPVIISGGVLQRAVSLRKKNRLPACRAPQGPLPETRCLRDADGNHVCAMCRRTTLIERARCAKPGAGTSRRYGLVRASDIDRCRTRFRAPPAA